MKIEEEETVWSVKRRQLNFLREIFEKVRRMAGKLYYCTLLELSKKTYKKKGDRPDNPAISNESDDWK